LQGGNFMSSTIYALAPAMAASLTSGARLTPSAAPLRFQNATVERNHGETENKRIV
jgi:hypothetical protein